MADRGAREGSSLAATRSLVGGGPTGAGGGQAPRQAQPIRQGAEPARGFGAPRQERHATQGTGVTGERGGGQGEWKKVGRRHGPGARASPGESEVLEVTARSKTDASAGKGPHLAPPMWMSKVRQTEELPGAGSGRDPMKRKGGRFWTLADGGGDGSDGHEVSPRSKTPSASEGSPLLRPRCESVIRSAEGSSTEVGIQAADFGAVDLGKPMTRAAAIEFDVARARKPLAAVAKMAQDGTRVVLDSEGSCAENNSTGERMEVWLMFVAIRPPRCRGRSRRVARVKLVPERLLVPPGGWRWATGWLNRRMAWAPMPAMTTKAR